MKIKTVLLPVILVLLLTSSGSSDRSLANIEAFARLYGYVKYFHPSDEAASIDWDKFLVYGIGKVEKASGKEDLNKRLYELFSPLVPGLKIGNENEDLRLSENSMISAYTGGYKNICWQHFGAGMDDIQEYKDNPYKSVRMNSWNQRSLKGYGFGNLMYMFNAEKFRGKKFRFSGKIKMGQNNEGSGHLWFRVDKTNGDVGFFYNMHDKPVKSTSWKNYEFNGLINEDADEIALGCFLVNDGILYTDDIKLFVEDSLGWTEIKLPNYEFSEDTLSKYARDGWIGTGPTYEIKWLKEHDGQQHLMSIRHEDDPNLFRDSSLFKEHARVGEYISKSIGAGLRCMVPLAMYGNSHGTYPRTDSSAFQKLQKSLKNIFPYYQKHRNNRLAAVIKTWNIFHFFNPNVMKPYEDQLLLLRATLSKTLRVKKTEAFSSLFTEFCASWKDGHTHVELPYYQRAYYAPYKWAFIESKLVITEVYDKNLPLKPGDVVMEVDGKTVPEFILPYEKEIAASTTGFLKYCSAKQSLLLRQAGTRTLKLENNSVVKISYYLTRKEYDDLQKPSNAYYRVLKNGIAYLDLDRIPMKTIDSLMSELAGMRGIICDLRGYPNDNHEFIQHLLRSKDTAVSWLKVPKIHYPEQDISFKTEGWEFEPTEPYLNARIVFLCDARAISYAESYLAFVKSYKLATLIGQATAGSNGNVIEFRTPAGYSVSFTGMQVVQPDGTPYYGKGIQPDIFVNPSIEGVRQGRDEILEKALEYLE